MFEHIKLILFEFISNDHNHLIKTLFFGFSLWKRWNYCHLRLSYGYLSQSMQRSREMVIANVITIWWVLLSTGWWVGEHHLVDGHSSHQWPRFCSHNHQGQMLRDPFWPRSPFHLPFDIFPKDWKYFFSTSFWYFEPIMIAMSSPFGRGCFFCFFPPEWLFYRTAFFFGCV